MNKGQLTIEYLLILVVLIILFTNVSTDLMDFTSSNTLQIQTKEIEKAHNQTLYNTMNSLSVQAPGARQTLVLNTPPDCAYEINADRISLNCREGTPSENYTGETIGVTPTDIQYASVKTISRGSTGEVTLEKTS